VVPLLLLLSFTWLLILSLQCSINAPRPMPDASDPPVLLLSARVR